MTSTNPLLTRTSFSNSAVPKTFRLLDTLSSELAETSPLTVRFSSTITGVLNRRVLLSWSNSIHFDRNLIMTLPMKSSRDSEPQKTWKRLLKVILDVRKDTAGAYD